MYDGWRSKHDVDLEWVNKTNDFMEATFGDACERGGGEATPRGL